MLGCSIPNEPSVFGIGSPVINGRFHALLKDGAHRSPIETAESGHEGIGNHLTWAEEGNKVEQFW